MLQLADVLYFGDTHHLGEILQKILDTLMTPFK